jgi:hypothetical protein
VGRSLWLEDGSAVYNWCWPSPAQSFSGPSLVGLATIFYCLRFRTSLYVASYNSQGYCEGIQPRLHRGSVSRWFSLCRLVSDRIENTASNSSSIVACFLCRTNSSFVSWRNSIFTVPLHSNGWRLLLNYSVMSQYLFRKFYSLLAFIFACRSQYVQTSSCSQLASVSVPVQAKLQSSATRNTCVRNKVTYTQEIPHTINI